MNSLQKSSDQFQRPARQRTAAKRKVAPAGNNELVVLLVKTSTGCMRSFSQLYQLTSPFMFAVALRVVKNREIAEEMYRKPILLRGVKPINLILKKGQFTRGLLRLSEIYPSTICVGNFSKLFQKMKRRKFNVARPRR